MYDDDNMEKTIIDSFLSKRGKLFEKERNTAQINQEPERDCGCGSESGNTRKEKNFVIVEDKKR